MEIIKFVSGLIKATSMNEFFYFLYCSHINNYIKNFSVMNINVNPLNKKSCVSLTCGVTSSANGFFSTFSRAYAPHKSPTWKMSSSLLGSTSVATLHESSPPISPGLFSPTSRPRTCPDAPRWPVTGGPCQNTMMFGDPSALSLAGTCPMSRLSVN